MRPIPKSLLIHDIVCRQETKKDRWGKSESHKDQKVEDVRIEPSSRIFRDKNRAEIRLSAEMFYDCKNSSPRNITFAEDDIIIFNGMKHKVVSVAPLYDGKRLHHYELGLVKDA